MGMCRCAFTAASHLMHVVNLVDSRENMTRFVRHYRERVEVRPSNFHIFVHMPARDFARRSVLLLRLM